MSSRSSVIRGSSIELTAIFVNAAEEHEDPTSLTISIYPPEYNPEDDSVTSADAWVYNATLTSGGSGSYASSSNLIEKIATGQFKYTFTVPTDATLGIAYDQWSGTVDSVDLETTFNFTIVGGGTIGTNNLYDNNVITVTLENISATDGTVLDDYEFYFTTTYTPLYSSVRKLRLEYGAHLNNLADDTLNLAIFEASTLADSLTWYTYNTSSNSYYQRVRKEWVTCKAAEILMTNILSGDGRIRFKKLGDFAVQYDTSMMRTGLERALSCLDKWLDTLHGGGYGVQTPVRATKGRFDPDRPPVGRGWDASAGIPVANNRYVPTGQRRYKNRFYKKNRV